MFQLFDQNGIVQIMPAAFLGLAILSSVATIVEIRRVTPLKVSNGDKVRFLSTLLPTYWIMVAWAGFLAFFTEFSRQHHWIAILPLYLYFLALFFGIKWNKEVIARVKKAFDDSRTEEEKRNSRRKGRRVFWVVVALGIWAIIAAARWKP